MQRQRQRERIGLQQRLSLNSVPIAGVGSGEAGSDGNPDDRLASALIINPEVGALGFWALCWA